MPFTRSLQHKLFTLVCLLYASDPDISLLGLSLLDYNSAKKYLPGVYCDLLYTTKTILQIIRL